MRDMLAVAELLVGSRMPDRSTVVMIQTKGDIWYSRLGVGCRIKNLAPYEALIVEKTSRIVARRKQLSRRRKSQDRDQW
jgi:hypothetical protein